MTTTLDLDPFGGLAGDMFLAACLDLDDERFDLAALAGFVRAMLADEARLDIESVVRRGLGARRLVVETKRDVPLRHLADLERVVAKAPLTVAWNERVVGALRELARVEARVHRIDVERVHFHELGAVDTLVDLAGAAFALERLGVERFRYTTPYVGGGVVATEHGELPVPAPATAELLRGVRQRRGPGGERVTPTGAVLLTCFGAPFSEATSTPCAIGYGAGSRDPELGPANLVRATLGEATSTRANSKRTRLIDELTFQLDDATGEEVGFLVEGLFEAGALDVWTAPIAMKKGRPGVAVHALAEPGARERLEVVAFRSSPTLGVRWRASERTELERVTFPIELEGRTIRIKRRIGAGSDGSSAWDLSPEYEDLAAWARETGRPLAELAGRAVEAAREIVRKG